MSSKTRIGHTILAFGQVESTNDQLKLLLKEDDLESGLVLDCYEQTQGRGQRDNKWQSKKGENVHLSIFFRPESLRVDRQFLMNEAVALALRQTIREYVPSIEVKIKWPNDILFNEYKIAGILIENVLQGSFVEHTIIGIGINVNQTSFEYFNRAASSLLLLGGTPIDLDRFKKSLFDHLGFFLSKINQPEYIQGQYERYLYGKMQSVLIQIPEKTAYFHIESIDTWGRIMLKDSYGTYGPFGFQELVFK